MSNVFNNSWEHIPPLQPPGWKAWHPKCFCILWKFFGSIKKWDQFRNRFHQEFLRKINLKISKLSKSRDRKQGQICIKSKKSLHFILSTFHEILLNAVKISILGSLSLVLSVLMKAYFLIFWNITIWLIFVITARKKSAKTD